MHKKETPDTLPEKELIARIRAGNKELFELIIRRNNNALYKTGRSYGFAHEDTQDLMQESYIQAFTGLSTFREEASLKTWLIRIMIHNCYKKQQKYSFKHEVTRTDMNETSIPMYAQKTQGDTGKTVLNGELNQVIEQSLTAVPADYRMVFALREINGLSVAETAEALEISEANVKVRLNRAKTMLRKQIEKQYTSEDIFEFNLIYCDRMVQQVMTVINTL